MENMSVGHQVLCSEVFRHQKSPENFAEQLCLGLQVLKNNVVGTNYGHIS